MIADNKLTDRSSWDDGKLAAELKELSDLAMTFEIEALGFEMPEVDLRIQSAEHAGQGEPEEEFEPPDGLPVTRAGDMWLLDRHRLMCGSALDGQTYESLFGLERASAIFTDPPYNVKIKGHVLSGKGKKRHREFAMASGEMTSPEFTGFLEQSFCQMVAYCAAGAVIYSCMDWRHMAEILTAIDAVDCELANLCVWVKTNAGMGNFYRSGHELVFVFGKRGEKRINNVQLGKFGRYRSNVWNYAGMTSFARRGQTRDLDLHPTVKPTSMVADAILDATERGSIVLDPFCGSGTTILAAERTGRRGYGIELDASYVDISIRRWQKLTRKSAVHSNGKTFDELCSERAGAMTSESPA